ncbi:hypothetical protein HK102_005693, partial [Quaeritorhiza haematococci]
MLDAYPNKRHQQPRYQLPQYQHSIPNYVGNAAVISTPPPPTCPPASDLLASQQQTAAMHTMESYSTSPSPPTSPMTLLLLNDGLMLGHSGTPILDSPALARGAAGVGGTPSFSLQQQSHHTTSVPVPSDVTYSPMCSILSMTHLDDWNEMDISHIPPVSLPSSPALFLPPPVSHANTPTSMTSTIPSSSMAGSAATVVAPWNARTSATIMPPTPPSSPMRNPVAVAPIGLGLDLGSFLNSGVAFVQLPPPSSSATPSPLNNNNTSQPGHVTMDHPTTQSSSQALFNSILAMKLEALPRPVVVDDFQPNMSMPVSTVPTSSSSAMDMIAPTPIMAGSSGVSNLVLMSEFPRREYIPTPPPRMVEQLQQDQSMAVSVSMAPTSTPTPQPQTMQLQHPQPQPALPSVPVMEMKPFSPQQQDAFRTLTPAPTPPPPAASSTQPSIESAKQAESITTTTAPSTPTPAPATTNTPPPSAAVAAITKKTRKSRTRSRSPATRTISGPPPDQMFEFQAVEGLEPPPPKK